MNDVCLLEMTQATWEKEAAKGHVRMGSWKGKRKSMREWPMERQGVVGVTPGV